ncbi:hypothetical protein BHE74_00016523 [Ensete ventricosum]|nr:hypothetical protein BHE74_00016523 [Ensete ventricosum]
MVNMSLMHGLSKVGGGCPTSASSMPVNASSLEQLAELASPLDVQKIPTDKVVRGTFVERMRGTSEVPSKHLVEELIGRRKKTKVSSRHRSYRGGDGQDKSESRAAKGKELTSPTEETPTARARPLSMKELCGNQHCYMALMDQVHDAGQVITSMDNKSEILREEIQKLKDGGNPDAVALAEQRAAEAR